MCNHQRDIVPRNTDYVLTGRHLNTKTLTRCIHQCAALRFWLGCLRASGHLKLEVFFLGYSKAALDPDRS